MPGLTCVQGPHASGRRPIPHAPRVSCLFFRHTARAEPALGHVVTSVDMDGQPFVRAVLPACRAHVGTAQRCPQLPDGARLFLALGLICRVGMVK